MNPIDELRRRLPQLACTDNPDDFTAYGQDWTRLAQPDPCAVVFPRSAEEVRQLVIVARELRLPLVPSGGRTGLSGGALAADRELVVSFERMNRILDFDPVDRLVTVEAGVVTQKLQDFAREQSLFYPVDFASKGSSQIGGNIATNAGGIKVLRYGMTRERVAGLKVVTGAGELLELNRGLVKNATGYDLRHLFIGSEGTLGFIVEATMELIDPPPPVAVMLLAAPDMASVMEIFRAARTELSLTAFEFFSHPALEKVLARHDLRSPFDAAADFYALVELELKSAADEEAALALFERTVEAGWAADGAISQSESQAAELWALRENITESIAPELPYKNDIAVRPSRVPDFLARLDALVAERYPDFEVIWFGHIGDGNLHLNMLKPAAMAAPEFRARCESVNDEVFALVAELGGTVSAEHGVGLLKRPYLQYSRSPEEIAAFRAIKQIFDPDGIMNPGKLITSE